MIDGLSKYVGTMWKYGICVEMNLENIDEISPNRPFTIY